ncbi:hypothetical protein ABTM18_19650, partial [Acinetobacter baumannii]
VAEAGIQALEDGRLIHPDLAESYQAFDSRSGTVVLLGSLDNINHLRSDTLELMGDLPESLRIPVGKDMVDPSGLRELTSHSIVCDGTLIG